MPRPICSTCTRPIAACYCDSLTSVFNQIKVLVIQHPSEEKHPFNTARMAGLCLKNSELISSNSLTSLQIEKILSIPSVLLYPSLQWMTNTLIVERADNSYQQLIVIDATWRKSKKILFEHPILQQLPRINLTGDLHSNYKIRTSKLANSLSTVESIVSAMEILEPQQDFQPLLSPFNRMIELQQSLDAKSREKVKH